MGRGNSREGGVPSTCLPLGCFLHCEAQPASDATECVAHDAAPCVHQASVCYKCGGTEVYDHRPIFNCDYCMRDVHQ